MMMLIHFHMNMISLMMFVNARMPRQVLLFGFSEGSLGSLITAENHRHLPEVHWRLDVGGFHFRLSQLDSEWQRFRGFWVQDS